MRRRCASARFAGVGIGYGLPIAKGGGRFGLSFGAGNCMDAGSDAFHHIGYAETVNNYDLTAWESHQRHPEPDCVDPLAYLARRWRLGGDSDQAPLVGPTLESYA